MCYWDDGLMGGRLFFLIVFYLLYLHIKSKIIRINISINLYYQSKTHYIVFLTDNNSSQGTKKNNKTQHCMCGSIILRKIIE